MRLKEVVFPLRYDRPYGPASAAFLLLVVFAEIEGLAFTALGILAGRTDLFLDLQYPIAPAAFLVAFATAAAVWFQQRAIRQRVMRYTADLSASVAESRFADRIGRRHTEE